MDSLILRENAKAELMKIKSVESGLEYLNKVKAIEVWAKAEKKDAELQNMIAEQKLRTQRILGQLIKDGQKAGEIAKPEQPKKINVPDGNIKPKTLTEIGITRKESSTFQTIASIPEKVFEKTIAIKRDAVNKAVSELTTTGMMKVAMEIKKQERATGLKNITIKKTEKKYRIIYADPPWKYNEVQHADEGNFHHKPLGVHYPSLSINELCQLDIKGLCDLNAVLFLWVTSPLLEESFAVINAWGFKYKTSMVWDKVKHNVGNYVSVRHEFLLICTKGSCTPDVKKLFDSVITEERTKHSVKPEAFRKVIDTIYTKGSRIELFARDIKIKGWDTWGNEA